jgi:hypothetical protein
LSPVADAAPGELTHVAGNALDADDEEPEAGNDRNEGTGIHGYAADIERGRAGTWAAFLAAAAVGRDAPVNPVCPVGGLNETADFSDDYRLSDGQATSPPAAP